MYRFMDVSPLCQFATGRFASYRSLSLLPLQSTHLKIDWINTGHHKKFDTIGKLNHQEPGVEAELNFEFFEGATVTVTINGLVKLSAFNAHICPSKYLASF